MTMLKELTKSVLVDVGQAERGGKQLAEVGVLDAAKLRGHDRRDDQFDVGQRLCAVKGLLGSPKGNFRSSSGSILSKTGNESFARF